MRSALLAIALPFAGAAWLSTPAAAQSEAEPTEPFRLHSALGLPDWLTLEVEHRTRYESVDEDFRAGRVGSNQLFALRTLAYVAADIDRFRVAAELMDSRAYDGPADGILNTTIVNAVELLQAHVGYRATDLVEQGDTFDIQAGRLTMNLGSRRLVARNRFRNTINGFTGLNSSYETADDATLRAFYVLPVQRLPNDLTALRDNEIEFDEELDRTQFAGLYGSMPVNDGAFDAEAYALRLDEEDQGGAATRDRRLWTIGARLHRDPAPDTTFFEWESAFQFGDSRTSSSSTTDLDHEAQFHHLSVGYRFDGESSLSVEALFDYASGDDDPNDGENNRFDTLFGARRFEFGPTGIFGAFARSNLVSPGLRMRFQPFQETRVMLATRLHYLASDQDAFTTSGLSDPTGGSGRFLGQLAEIRIRHELVEGSVNLEFGLAHLFAGTFLEEAPGSDGEDSTYVYATTVFKL